MAKHADWRVVARFSVIAATAAIAGASLLNIFDKMPVVASYTLGGSTFEITVIKAVIVDAARLIVYGTGFMASHFAQSQELLAPVAVGPICAFIGSFVGQPVLQKVTLATVQIVVAGAMLLIGVGLAAGLV
jgi:hypothetical protein